MSLFGFGTKPKRRQRQTKQIAAPAEVGAVSPENIKRAVEASNRQIIKHGGNPPIHREEPLSVPASVISKIVLTGDLAGLQGEEIVQYYTAFCQRLGLDPATKPFTVLELKAKAGEPAKKILYCDRGGAAQLTKLHGVSRKIISREEKDGLYVVVAQASTPDGRSDESIGAVPIFKYGYWGNGQNNTRKFIQFDDPEKFQGEELANAMMKAETKAKRRAVLDLLGLGMLDESEVESQQEPVDTSKLAEATIDKRESDRLEEAGQPGAGAKPIKVAKRTAKDKATEPTGTSPIGETKQPEPSSEPVAEPTGIPWREKAITCIPVPEYSGKKLGELTLKDLAYLKESWADKYAEKIAKNPEKALLSSLIHEGFKELLQLEQAKK